MVQVLALSCKDRENDRESRRNDMAGWYLFLVIIVAVVGMVLLISRFKWHPFIVLLLAGYFVGILWVECLLMI